MRITLPKARKHVVIMKRKQPKDNTAKGWAICCDYQKPMAYVLVLQQGLMEHNISFL